MTLRLAIDSLILSILVASKGKRNATLFPADEIASMPDALLLSFWDVVSPMSLVLGSEPKPKLREDGLPMNLWEDQLKWGRNSRDWDLMYWLVLCIYVVDGHWFWGIGRSWVICIVDGNWFCGTIGHWQVGVWIRWRVGFGVLSVASINVAWE